MKIFAAALGLCLFALPTSSYGWAGMVCNYSDYNVSVTFGVAASAPFTLNVPKHTDTEPRSVAGLCVNSVSAENTSVSPPKHFSTPGGGWGQCSNAVVSISNGRGGPMGHYVRTGVGVAKSTCDN